ncbi:hypothetical protein KC345_g5490 [Hortaea werneckii]|nr:hypothetical protein KC345_g5490 [Hortaea werneckii]
MDPSMEDKIAKRIEILQQIKSTLDSLLKEDIPDMKQAAAKLDATAKSQILTMKEWVSYLRQQEAYLAEEKRKAIDEISDERSRHKTEMRTEKDKINRFRKKLMNEISEKESQLHQRVQETENKEKDAEVIADNVRKSKAEWERTLDVMKTTMEEDAQNQIRKAEALRDEARKLRDEATQRRQDAERERLMTESLIQKLRPAGSEDLVNESASQKAEIQSLREELDQLKIQAGVRPLGVPTSSQSVYSHSVSHQNSSFTEFSPRGRPETHPNAARPIQKRQRLEGESRCDQEPGRDEARPPAGGSGTDGEFRQPAGLQTPSSTMRGGDAGQVFGIGTERRHVQFLSDTETETGASNKAHRTESATPGPRSRSKAPAYRAPRAVADYDMDHPVSDVTALLRVFDVTGAFGPAPNSLVPLGDLPTALRGSLEPHLRAFRTDWGLKNLQMKTNTGTVCATARVHRSSNLPRLSDNCACDYCQKYFCLCIHAGKEMRTPIVMPRPAHERVGIDPIDPDFGVPPADNGMLV